MGRFRWWRRALLALFLSVCAAIFLALIFVQVEQRLFRRRVERLVAEIQSFELRKTPWPEAQARLARWSANTERDAHCDEHKCSLTITLHDFVFGYVSERNAFERLDDYFRWKLNLTYSTGPFYRLEMGLVRLSMRAGGHPAKIVADVGMREGIVWSKGISIWIETYVHDVEICSGSEWCEYTLMAQTGSASSFRLHHSSWVGPQLMLHPNYSIGRPDGCEGCVLGWAKFTPYADPADVHRLMELNLSCLTKWHPCRTQMDIMPNAWTQYEADGLRVDALWDHITCSPLMLELLGRDNAHIAVGEIVAYEEKVDGPGYYFGTASVRMMERLKGAEDWNIGEMRSLPVEAGKMSAIESLRPGTKLIFAGRVGYTKGMEINLNTLCRVISANEANLTLVRRGIAQDYQATEQTK